MTFVRFFPFKLPFNEGDVLVVLSRDDENWWYCEHNRKRGKKSDMCSYCLWRFVFTFIDELK